MIHEPRDDFEETALELALQGLEHEAVERVAGQTLNRTQLMRSM
jgi:hypothetical protein